MMHEYAQDPRLSVAALSTGNPLQATDFCGLGGEAEMEKIRLVQGTPGDSGAPYADAAFFYASHRHVKFGTDMASKPFFFFTGDQVVGSEWYKLRSNVLKTMDPIAALDTWRGITGLWSQLKEKYHVFYLAAPGNNAACEWWRKTLGKEHVLLVPSAKAVVDCIIGTIAITSGSRTLAGYCEDLGERGVAEQTQKEVALALSSIDGHQAGASKTRSRRTAELCRYFERGFCRNGKDCKYLHGEQRRCTERDGGAGRASISAGASLATTSKAAPPRPPSGTSLKRPSPTALAVPKKRPAPVQDGLRQQPTPSRNQDLAAAKKMIRSVATQTEPRRTTQSRGTQTEPHALESGFLECTVCNSSERTTMFAPCNHVVTCADCALLVSSCPCCRRRITSRVRIFLS